MYPADDGGVVVYFRGVTQRRRTEAGMRQLQRLEDLRSLAMAVAHDFNNLATVIHGSLYLLRERLDNEQSEEDLAAIAQAARASEKLARQLVDFGNAQQLSPRKETVNAVLERIRPLVERLVGADIQVTMQAAEPDVAFLADPDQLDRVLLNLASNARHAMSDGGQLSISADVHEVPEGSDQGMRASTGRPLRHSDVSLNVGQST